MGLNPCPFCGGEAKAKEMFGGITGVDCSTCGAVVSFRGNEGKRKAITAWNRRYNKILEKESLLGYKAKEENA